MTTPSVKKLHVLSLDSSGSAADLLRHWGDLPVEVEHVASGEQVLELLRTRSFDVAVLSGHDLNFLRGISFPEGTTSVFDAVNAGMGILGETGQFEWVNPKMAALSEDLRERVLACCRESLTWAQSSGRTPSALLRGRRFSLSTERGEQFEVTVTPITDHGKRVSQVVAVVWDATKSRRLQDKIDAIDRAGRELLSLDAEHFARLDAQERLALLEEKIRRCMEEHLHFENFEVRVLNKLDNKLELVLSAGIPAETDTADLFASPEGNGICGYVAARGRSYICPDTSNDSRYRPGLPGARSSLTVPLALQDKIVGVANFESSRLAAFNEDDRQFAEIFARYIALALHVLELLVTERHATTGRLGKDVMAGITSPLNDILTDVESLVEDYIGHDDLRHRLRNISENAVRIRSAIKEVTSAKPGLIGARAARGRRHDPVLTGKRILVADDEDMIRETVRDVLTGFGCEVVTATDGATAVALLEKDAFDLVLSDIKMPGRSGYEVFAAAKQMDASTPVILTTGFGYDPNHTIIRARREGLAAVLFKPFKVDQLLGEIRMALSSVRL